MAVIYALMNPQNGNVFYIGQTKNIKNRFAKHKYSCKMEHLTPCSKYIKYLNDIGLSPKCFIIEEVEHDDRLFWEAHYIGLFKSWYPDLTNQSYKGNSYSKGNTNMRRSVSTIINNETIIYKSITHAAEELKIGRRSINNNLSGFSHFTHGLKFKYV